MNKLYEKISSLCEQRKIKPGRMCGDIGISRGNITDLKMGRIESLSAETLSKISAYFGVTVDYLIGKTGFPYPDLTGKTMRFELTEKAPSENGEGKVDEADLKAAFWGGEKDLSPEELDEMWEDVKEYARYKMEQRRRKNDKPSGAL